LTLPLFHGTHGPPIPAPIPADRGNGSEPRVRARGRVRLRENRSGRRVRPPERHKIRVRCGGSRPTRAISSPFDANPGGKPSPFSLLVFPATRWASNDWIRSLGLECYSPTFHVLTEQAEGGGAACSSPSGAAPLVGREPGPRAQLKRGPRVRARLAVPGRRSQNRRLGRGGSTARQIGPVRRHRGRSVRKRTGRKRRIGLPSARALHLRPLTPRRGGPGRRRPRACASAHGGATKKQPRAKTERYSNFNRFTALPGGTRATPMDHESSFHRSRDDATIFALAIHFPVPFEVSPSPHRRLREEIAPASGNRRCYSFHPVLEDAIPRPLNRDPVLSCKGPGSPRLAGGGPVEKHVPRKRPIIFD